MRRLPSNLKNVAGFFIASALLIAGQAFSEQITVTTFYSDPVVGVRDLKVNQTINVGVAGADGTAFFQSKLRLNNNGYRGWEKAGGASLAEGGNWDVDGDFSVYTSLGERLFYVASPGSTRGLGASQVGIMTANTYLLSGAELDVRGHVKTMIQHATSNATSEYAPRSEIYYEYASGETSGFAAVSGIKNVNQRFIPLYIDANPLCFQTITKEGSKGQVYIRSKESRPNGDPTVILIVGDDDESTNPSYAYANSWNVFELNTFKSGVEPLSIAQRREALQKLADTKLYWYRYKGDSSERRLRLGFIAEESPEEILISSSNKGKSLNLGDAVGFLLASAKALQEDGDEIEARARKLEMS